MSVVSGIDGDVSFTGGYTTRVRSWSINIVVEAVDITQLGSDWQENQSGIKEATGQYTALVDDAAFTSLSGLIPGTAAAFFSFSDGASSDGRLAGAIFVTGMSVSDATASGAVEVTFDFRFTGTVTLVAHS